MSCYKYLHWEEKQKYHITFFCEKNKSIILHHVLPNSPGIVLLRPLLFWWENHFILLREKESKLCLQEEQYISFNEQRKCHVRNVYTVEEKPKVSYYITFFQTLLRTFLLLKLQQQRRNGQTKYKTISKWRRTDVSYGFHRNASLHGNQRFLNGNAIADELPNIQFHLTTVWDTSLTGIQTYFIYSSRIIGKPPWIHLKVRSKKQIKPIFVTDKR